MYNKFIFTLLLLLGISAVSCKKENANDCQSTDKTLEITATIAAPEQTRVSYSVDNASTHTVTPSWSVGDKVFGFDDLGVMFTFTVESVDGNGKATFSDGGYVPGTATKLYAIYAPGKTIANLEGAGSARTLSVDLSAQSGSLNNSSPVLMCSTGAITAGNVAFEFQNKTAIVGVTKFKLPTAAVKTVNSVKLEGAVTTGVFSVSGGELVLTPGSTPGVVTASGSWETAATGLCSTPVYFAVMPTTGANLCIDAIDEGKVFYSNITAIDETDLAAGYYYYLGKNLGVRVAEVAGVKYEDFADAVTAAKAATSDVTIKLLSNLTYTTAMSLTNSGSHVITLDLNGNVLSTNVQAFITTGKTLIVTDSAPVKGKITSSQSQIIKASGVNAHITISDCVIECTKTEGGSWNKDAVVYVYCSSENKKTYLDIDGAKIYATKKVSTLINYYGTVTINNSEISSGTVSTGWYAILTVVGDTTIDWVSSYTSGTGNASTCHIADASGSVVVNDGYFYSSGRVASAGNDTQAAKMTLNGGYYNMDRSLSTIKLGDGLTFASITPINHTHETTGALLSYGYQVK